MSQKNLFNKYRYALIALVILSVFSGSLYISELTLSQNSANYTPLLLYSLLNSNSNAGYYPTGWQPGIGTIPVIEKVSGTYYNYSESWQYQYLNGTIQTRVTHTLQNSTVDYLLVGHLNGWNFNSTSSGTLVSYQDPNMINYYWIQSPTTVTINITFNVDQLHSPHATITAPVNDETIITGGVWINGTYNDFPSQITLINISDNRFTLVNPSGSTPYGCTGTFSFEASGIPTSNFDVNVTVQDGTGLNGTATRHVIVDKSPPIAAITIPPTDNTPLLYNNVWINGTYNGTGSQVYSIFINDSRFTLVAPISGPPYGETGTFSFKLNASQNIEAGELGVTVTVIDGAGFVGTATRHLIIVDKSQPIVNITSPPTDNAILPYGSNVWINGTYNGTGSQVYSIFINDSRFTLVAPISGPPYGETGAFSFKLNASQGIEAGELGVTVTVQDEAGLNGTATRQVIIVDTTPPIVNITSPPTDNAILPYNNVWINGTYNGTGSQVYSIFINDSRFTLVAPISGPPYGETGAFSFKLNASQGIQAGELGVTVTVIDGAGLNGTATRHVIVDKSPPIAVITIPPTDNAPLPYGSGVWINGTYNGTGSQVYSIFINDSRFTLVAPISGPPYGETGAFSFKPISSQGIEAGVFGVTVTVIDSAGLNGTATRRVNVTWGQGTAIWSFNVTSFDGLYVLPAKFFTNNAGTRQPLVVLVHGLGSDLSVWETTFINMTKDLLANNFTVVTYTQRPGASTVNDNITSFSYLMKDLYAVINTANQSYGGTNGVLDGSRIGLVGHSLGSYVVTMAACTDLGYLQGYQSSLKVVVEGDGPANLYDAAQYILSNQPGQQLLVDWINNNTQALSEAQSLSPVNSGENTTTAWMNNNDHCDSIPHNLAFYVVHNWDDLVIPLTNGDILYNDIAYDSLNSSKSLVNNRTSELYRDWSFVGHNTWSNPDFCLDAANYIAEYI
ncbi:MAG: alpha/beta fold hydrolase [Candidatus Freyarchaeum deiterrae]